MFICLKLHLLICSDKIQGCLEEKKVWEHFSIDSLNEQMAQNELTKLAGKEATLCISSQPS